MNGISYLRICPLVALAFASAAFGAPLKLGYEYDITREKTPTAATMRRVADIVSALGYGQLQLYFKDNFAYPAHPKIWRDRAHLTPGEVKDFDAYCRSKGLELVPYQSSFGHLEPWMAHAEYRAFAEHPQERFYCPEFEREFTTAAVCPTDPKSLDFLNGLFDVLLPCFSSPYANLGCDEVWDLHTDTGRSGAEIRAKGTGRVYFDFILKLHAALKARGKTLMFWSDIIKNYPELVRELPADVVALEWGYEADSPWAYKALGAAPCRYWLCPGTSSWNSYFGRHANMRANVKSAWKTARSHGAEGILLADWGDSGYPQPWLVSLPALVYTAALVRDGRELTDAELAEKVDAICGCKVGAYLIRASNAYLKAPSPGGANGTQLFRYCSNPAKYKMPEHLTNADFEAVVRQIRDAVQLRDLTGAPDWVRDDVALLDLLTDFAARRVAGDKEPLADVYRERYTALWLRQNRPGGVEASLEKVFGKTPTTAARTAATAATVAARDLTPLTDLEVRKGEIVWVENGKAAMPIAADMKDAESAAAARFLQECVAEMTGVKVKIVPVGAREGTRTTEGKPAVRIGKPDPRDGSFTVEIGPGGVTLSGNGPYAAYDFAERVLGVRQYFDPKKGGRSVLGTDRLALPFAKWSDRPVYLKREMHPATLPWTNPFRKGNQLADGHSHRVHVPRWASDTNCDYRVTRPEIFELKADGKRAVGNMLCYGNPRTLATYVERIDEELAGGRKSGMVVMPERKTINVSQDDAGLACHCEYCRKLADKSLGSSGVYAPVLWRHFVPALSDIAAKKWPDYTISILPYHNTCLCLPDVTFTNGNVEATLVTHPGLALLKDRRVKAEEEAKMRAWQKCTGRKIVNWHYLIYPATFTSAPYLFGDAIVAHYRDMRETIAGTYIDQYSRKRGGHELDLYVWFKALWNPDIDPDAVYDVFCERMFGRAAPEMREVIRMLCDGWKRDWEVPTVTQKNVFGTSYPVAETRKMKSLIDAARPKLADDAHARLCFDCYTHFFQQFFEDSEDYASGGNLAPLEIMKTPERPKVDGILDDEAWKAAKKADFVEAMNDERKIRPPREACEMRAVWTPGAGVTFGYRCAEAHMGGVARKNPPCVKNDQIELFIDPSGAGNGGYLQLAFDINGGSMFYRSKHGSCDWHGEGVEIAVHEGTDHWSVEVYVPFASLKEFPGARLPDLGAVNLYWTGNSTRMQFGGCVKDCYRGCYFSRLYTKFHWFNNHAPAFGRFMFKEW